MLGKYCEKLDPSMAFLAYKRAGGACDEELLRVTSENGLFKNQARYLVEKQDMNLWAKVRVSLFSTCLHFGEYLVCWFVWESSHSIGIVESQFLRFTTLQVFRGSPGNTRRTRHAV